MSLPFDTQSALEELSSNFKVTPKTMPPSFYKDEAMMPTEIDELFINGWVCVGRGDEIPDAGDYYTLDIFSEPLIISRNKDGAISVLSNVCRHRGSQLLSGKGNSKRFTCPYHRWSYDLNGALLAAPLVDKSEGFDRNECRLPSFRLHEWWGWLFVNLSGTAEEFDTQIIGLDQHVENYHAEQMRSIAPEIEHWPLNWKCLAENFMEGYHLTPVHRDTLHPMTPTRLCHKIPGGSGYTGYKAHYSPGYEGRAEFHPDMTKEERALSMMVWVYPGFVAAISPNSAVYMSITPQGPTELQTRWDVIAREATFENGEAYARLEFARSFNAEDRDRLLDVQKGLSSRFATRGYLAPPDYEGTVWDFYHYIAAKLLPGLEPPATINTSDVDQSKSDFHRGPLT